MKTQLRKEEYTALGDFILPSFVRDQAAIVVKFPKFNAAFLDHFTSKLAFVKNLESRLVKTEQQKGVTASLYKTAILLNNELTVLNNYIADAELNTAIISALKVDLYKRNIEGVILKTVALKEYVIEHKVALEEQGMPIDYEDILDDFITQLETKNAQQNGYMNALKELTETNSKHYDELYGFINKIATKGKLIFKDSIRKDEYSIRKCVKRMRVAKAKKEDPEKE